MAACIFLHNIALVMWSLHEMCAKGADEKTLPVTWSDEKNMVKVSRALNHSATEAVIKETSIPHERRKAC